MTEPARVRFGPWRIEKTRLLWLTAGLVMLCEYLIVSLLFDAAGVKGRGGVWALVGRIGAVAPIGVVVATALLLFRTEAPQPGQGVGLPRARQAFLLGMHAAAYGAFVVLTSYLYGAERPPAGPAWLWLLAWALTGVGAAVALFAGLVGTRPFVRRLTSAWVLAPVAMGAAAWLAGDLSGALWRPLSHLALLAVGALLQVLGQPVTVDPAEMGLELNGFAVQVAAVCSGIEGMGLISVLLSGYVVVLRREFRFPNALLLVPIGVVAVWVGNSIRLAGLMLIGAYVSPDIALGGFHSKAGWVLFCAITLAVAELARRSPFFSARGEVAEGENVTAPYVVPLLAMVATALVTAMFAQDIDPLYGARLVPTAIVLYAYRRHYLDLLAVPSIGSVAIGAVVGALWVVSGPRGTLVPAGDPVVLFVAIRVLGSVVLAPICEELAFRGFLLRRLVAADFLSVSFKTWTPLALVVSSLIFGVLHGRWFLGLIAGAVYAVVQIRSGRLADAVTAHATTNAVVAAHALWTGDWSSWS